MKNRSFNIASQNKKIKNKVIPFPILTRNVLYIHRVDSQFFIPSQIFFIYPKHFEPAHFKPPVFRHTMRL